MKYQGSNDHSTKNSTTLRLFSRHRFPVINMRKTKLFPTFTVHVYSFHLKVNYGKIFSRTKYMSQQFIYHALQTGTSFLKNQKYYFAALLAESQIFVRKAV